MIQFIIGLILLLVLILFVIVFKPKTDGMVNSGITNIYYRTYTKENGWSKWTKNGLTSGNLKDNILNIQVKVDKKTKGEARYRVYSEKNNWSDEYGSNASILNQNITGVRFGLSETKSKTSNICYRTYNKENEWMEWSCDSEINGNKNENIKAIEIKIVPKESSLEDYLKDYSKKNTISIEFDEEGE